MKYFKLVFALCLLAASSVLVGCAKCECKPCACQCDCTSCDCQFCGNTGR